jgi:hypothetical protein
MPYGVIHLYKYDVNFLFIHVSVHKVYNKFSSQFPQQLLITDIWNFGALFLLACHIVGFIFVRIQCQLPVDLCVCPRMYNKFSSQFPQQLLILGAWSFSTLFHLACHIVEFIFVWIRCQLPVYSCVCPYSILKGYSHRFSRFVLFFTMHNLFLIIRQNVRIIWPVKKEIQGSNALLCKQRSTHLYHHMY